VRYDNIIGLHKLAPAPTKHVLGHEAHTISWQRQQQRLTLSLHHFSESLFSFGLVDGVWSLHHKCFLE